MQNLYNELVSGTNEYHDDGHFTTRPPSLVMLRAARAMQELTGINSTNNLLIQQLQKREEESMQAEQKYHDQEAYLHEVIRNLSIQLKECNESLCKSIGETSVLADSRGLDASSSDSSSEGCTGDQNYGPSAS